VLRSLRQCAPLQPKIFLCMSLITFMYAWLLLGLTSGVYQPNNAFIVWWFKE
jgi:hypothetical protein